MHFHNVNALRGVSNNCQPATTGIAKPKEFHSALEFRRRRIPLAEAVRLKTKKPPLAQIQERGRAIGIRALGDHSVGWAENILKGVTRIAME